jgi:hypothetical protein
LPYEGEFAVGRHRVDAKPAKRALLDSTDRADRGLHESLGWGGVDERPEDQFDGKGELIGVGNLEDRREAVTPALGGRCWKELVVFGRRKLQEESNAPLRWIEVCDGSTGGSVSE